MEAKSVFDVLEQWEVAGEMTDSMAGAIAEQFDQLMQHELEEIDTLAYQYKPDVAFCRLLRLIYVLNMAIAKRPSILEQLAKHLAELRDKARKVAKKFEANGLTLGLQVPLGLYIEVSFDTS